MAEEVQKVQLVPLDITTLAFHGTVDANSNKTLVSKRITVPFVTHKLKASFALNCNKLLRIEFFVSPDDSTPTAKPLTGISLLSELGQVSYLVGDDEDKEVPLKVLVDSAGMFLKVYAQNTDSWAHTIDAQIFIQSLTREGE